MNVELAVYRARAGCYLGKAVTGNQKLRLSSLSSVLSCISLIFFRPPFNVTVGLFVFLFASDQALISDVITNCINVRERNNKSSSNNPFRHSSCRIKSAIVLSGDVEPNPGPQVRNDLNIIHLNAN